MTAPRAEDSGTPGDPEAGGGGGEAHPPLDVAAEAAELPVHAHETVGEDVEAPAGSSRLPGPGHGELVPAQLQGAGQQAQQLGHGQQRQLAVARPQAAQLPRRDGRQAGPGRGCTRRRRHPAARRSQSARSGAARPSGALQPGAERRRRRRRAAFLSARRRPPRPAPGPRPQGAPLRSARSRPAAGPQPTLTHPPPGRRPRARSSSPGAGRTPAAGWGPGPWSRVRRWWAGRASTHPGPRHRTRASKWRRRTLRLLPDLFPHTDRYPAPPSWYRVHGSSRHFFMKPL